MKITLYENNAKDHNDKQLELLAKIVKEVGWRQNVEVNQQGVIIAGHGRYMAWEKYKDEYGLPDVWVTDDTGKTIQGEHAKTPLTEQQEKMWRLADNQVNAMTGVDMSLVIPELKAMPEDMLLLTGFSKDLILDPDVPMNLNDEHFAKSPRMVIMFKDFGDLESAKGDIKELLAKYEGAYISYIGGGEL